MRTLNLALLATVAAAALTTATVAADPVMMVAEPAPVVMDAATGWDGPYAGIFVLGQSDPGSFGVGVNVGVNFSTDGLLLGVEGDISWLSAGGWEGQVIGKAGAMITDTAAIYGLVGYGADSFNGGYVPVGAGVEFGVADNLSIKAQYEYHWDTTAPGVSAHVGKVGLNWHF